MLEIVKAITYAGGNNSTHFSCICDCVNCDTYMKHKNRNKEEALVQEFMPYVVNVRYAMG
jgi:hypothetical protein